MTTLTGLVIALQVIRATALSVMMPLLRQHRAQEEYPPLHLDEVQVGNNTLQLYMDGHDLYEAMLTAIDGAQESIYLEASTWKEDQVGTAFKQHLIQKALQGVSVSVIFGGFGHRATPRAFKSLPPGMHVLEYAPFRRPWHLLDPRRYAQDHRKLLVVDGSTAFIGGYNLENLSVRGWRDTHLQICGPAAADVAHAFSAHWNQFSAPPERITRRYPRQFNPLIVVRANDALRLTFPIRDMYIEAIDRAEHSILLTNASFVPDHSLLAALRAAVIRGVKVCVLVPWPSNRFLADRLTCGTFTQCLQAGMRLYGYRQAMLRAKTCTIDGQWSTIGSAHLDLLSSVVNYECNVEVYDAALASQMQDLFAYNTAGAVEVPLACWMNRSWYRKLSERILAPLRILL